MRLIVPASLAAVLVAIVIAIPTAQQQQTGAYTQRQADAGRTAYEVSCAGCHGPDLNGSSDAPPLTGPNFTGAWGARPVNDLFTHTMKTMPPPAPGSLGEEMTLNIVAYVHPASGRQSGNAGADHQDTANVNAAIRARMRSSIDGARCRNGQRTGSRRCRCRARRHREGRSEELRPCDTGDVEESASWRLAHLPPQLSRVELQPAESNHARQRARFEACMGLGDERFRRQSNDADRSQRRHVSREPQQYRPGARREDRQPHLGNARRSRIRRRATAASAASRSRRTRSSCRRATRTWWR